MKEVFKVAAFDKKGNLTLLQGDYASYPDAVAAIEKMKAGTYQVQKVFIKS